MKYLSSDQAKKYILVNFSLIDLFCLFDLLDFQKKTTSNDWYNDLCDNIFFVIFVCITFAVADVGFPVGGGGGGRCPMRALFG